MSIVIVTECLVCNDCLITSSCKQIADYIANSVLQIKKLLINYGYHHIFCPGVVMTILENLAQNLIKGFIHVKLVHNNASSVAKNQFSLVLKREL